MSQNALSLLSTTQRDLLSKYQQALALAGVGDFLDALAAAIGHGRPNINVLRIAANVTDGQKVVIGGVTYEFDISANGVTAGNIAVAPSDGTPANATPALAAAINANQGGDILATVIGDNELLIQEQEALGRALGCTETLAGSNNAWAAATMYGGVLPGTQHLAVAARAPNATEVALATMHFVFDAAVTILAVLVRVGATGELKVWKGGLTATGNQVDLTLTGDGDWATTDTVVVIATST